MTYVYQVLQIALILFRGLGFGLDPQAPGLRLSGYHTRIGNGLYMPAVKN